MKLCDLSDQLQIGDGFDADVMDQMRHMDDSSLYRLSQNKNKFGAACDKATCCYLQTCVGWSEWDLRWMLHSNATPDIFHNVQTWDTFRYFGRLLQGGWIVIWNKKSILDKRLVIANYNGFTQLAVLGLNAAVNSLKNKRPHDDHNLLHLRKSRRRQLHEILLFKVCVATKY